jgi:hypothetical protein
MTDQPLDARDEAFAALLPLAEPTERAVELIENTLSDERKLLGVSREGLNVGQLAALNGLARFAHGVVACGNEWDACASVRRVSTPSQETGGIYLWLLEDRFMMRLKHEPVEPRVDPGALRLSPELPAPGHIVQIYLTWDISLQGTIVRPMFTCLEEPTWTIPLSELLAHARPPATALQTPKRGPVVRSTREADETAGERPEQPES